MQRGFGLGSLFRRFYRTTLPFAKTGAKFLGTTLLDTGANIIKDVAKGRNLRKSVEKRGKLGGLELLNKVKTQVGSGQSWKRKRLITDLHHSRSKQGRISNETKGYLHSKLSNHSLCKYTKTISVRNSLRMAHKLHESSSECSVSASDLFYVLLTQISVEKGTWVDVYPITSVSDTGPIEFEYEGKQQEFLDLAHTLLYVTVPLVKSDGSEIYGGSKVAPVNFFLHSLFGQLDIDLNGGTLSDGSSTYPCRAYLETLLSYGEEAKSTHLTSFLFYKDTAGKMGDPDPTKVNQC